MNKAMLLKQYMFNNKKKSARLPSAYQEVEYIESTGTQWIFVDKEISTPLKVNVEFNINSYQETKLFELKNTNDVSVYTPIGFNASKQIWCNYNGWFGSGNNYYTPNKKSKMIAYFSNGNQQITLDGNIISSNTATKDYNFNKVTLFGYIWSGTTVRPEDIMKGKIYNFSIEKDNSIIVNLIPCYRKSDNEVGLYDIVNNQFYTNQGTGSFLCGRPLVNIDGYEQLDYIYTNSTTERAFIDTGIARNTSDISIDIDFQQLEIAKTLYTYFVSEGGNFPSAGSGWGFGNAQTNWSLIQPGTGYNTFGTIDYNRKKVNISLVGSTITISGDLSKSTTWSYYGTNQPYVNKNIWLFGAIQNSSAVKVFNCKIKKDNVLVRNFIPMRRKLDNEVGLYDLVTKTFYTNQGSGEFIAGGKL